MAHLIEGSVRQNGERIRIVVNLIRAKDGASVWSHSYDQPLKDVFAIQSQIGKAVAKALQVKLLGKSPTNDEKPPSGNVEAYRLMLQGRAVARRQTEADYRQGIALMQQVLKFDPDYAYAWGVLSNYQINPGVAYLRGDARQQSFNEARKAVDKEFSLAPDTAAAHLDRSYALSTMDGDQMDALAECRRALALAPNDGTAMAFLGLQYGILGQQASAIDLLRKAIVTDPLRADWFYNLSFLLGAKGDLGPAGQAIRKAAEPQPDYPGAFLQIATFDILRGDAAAPNGKPTPLQRPWLWR